ncbi:MAG: hypothetical protein R2862_04135 [Thermoanaerobaculia bacterium]
MLQLRCVVPRIAVAVGESRPPANSELVVVKLPEVRRWERDDLAQWSGRECRAVVTAIPALECHVAVEQGRILFEHTNDIRTRARKVRQDRERSIRARAERSLALQESRRFVEAELLPRELIDLTVALVALIDPRFANSAPIECLENPRRGGRELRPGSRIGSGRGVEVRGDGSVMVRKEVRRFQSRTEVTESVEIGVLHEFPTIPVGIEDGPLRPEPAVAIVDLAAIPPQVARAVEAHRLVDRPLQRAGAEIGVRDAQRAIPVLLRK